MIPQYIPTQTTPVCIYGRYDAIVTADGMLDCPNGGRIVGRECILYEEAMVVLCSQTPTPSRSAEASKSAEPSKIAEPSSSSKPSSSPTKPIISATITIEIRTNMTIPNNATNTTVL